MSAAACCGSSTRRDSAAVLCTPCRIASRSSTSGTESRWLPSAVTRSQASTAALSRRVEDPQQAAAMMAGLRTRPPTGLAGIPVRATDLLEALGEHRTDALILAGGDVQTSVRVVVRPSGTEPKVKCYTEVRRAVTGELTAARRAAADIQEKVLEAARGW